MNTKQMLSFFANFYTYLLILGFITVILIVNWLSK